jgi:hypothetical protein
MKIREYLSDKELVFYDSIMYSLGYRYRVTAEYIELNKCLFVTEYCKTEEEIVRQVVKYSTNNYKTKIQTL